MKFQDILWYNLKIPEVFETLDSSEIGLEPEEAQKRLKIFGFNKLPRKKKISSWKIFFQQFQSVLVYILIVASIFSLILTEYVDFFIILAAVVLNVIVGYLQESKAEKELENLQKIITYKARVYRGGVLREINSEELVPGDLVSLQAGDQVPADLRLIKTNNLSCAEAILTGESRPVVKTIKAIGQDKNKKVLVSKRKNIAHKGTLVSDGSGLGVVIGTGRATEIGKIASLLEKTVSDETPLQEKLRKFSRLLGFVILTVAALIVIVGLLRGIAFWEIFFIGMAAAVASVPEGLLVAVTVILAIGMRRILKKQALVRRLVAAETLGNTSVVCVDKTGTITKGEMKAVKLVSYDKVLKFNGHKKQLKTFKKIVETTLLCNNAVAEEKNGNEYKLIGSPTEKALLQASLNALGNKQKIIDGYKRLVEIPFTSRAKIMFTASQAKENILWAAKGAPEVVLDKCSHYYQGGKKIKLNAKNRKKWVDKFDEYSKQGYRLLAVCEKQSDKYVVKAYKKNDFVFWGFWALTDPIRPQIKETIKLAKQSGIRTIMLTGDHRLTAVQIARQIGLKVKEKNVIDGEKLLTMTDSELQQAVKKVTVFARVSPQDKLKIVDALQSNGEVVAMTGDGVNDAPALKSADIGIAVSAGSDVTKSTADMVLLDNNLSTIISAIEQGRIIFNNVRKLIVYLLSDSFSELILILSSLVFNLPLPITAVQILWINLITDGFPAASLTVEKGDADIMSEKPMKRTVRILNREMKVLIFVIGAVTSIILFLLFYYLYYSDLEITLIRSVIFAVLGLDSLFYVFSCKSLVRPIWRTKIFDNKYLILAVLGGIILQLLPLYVPALQQIFDLQALPGLYWIWVFALGFLNIILIEIVKWIYNHKTKRYRV